MERGAITYKTTPGPLQLTLSIAPHRMDPGPLSGELLHLVIQAGDRVLVLIELFLGMREINTVESIVTQ